MNPDDPSFRVQDLGDGVAIVSVHEVILGTAADELAGRLTDIADGGSTRFVIDLTAVEMLNSKLLDALVRFAARLDPRKGGGLAVVTSKAYVRHMLEISADGGLVLLAESRDDALEALGAGS